MKHSEVAYKTGLYVAVSFVVINTAPSDGVVWFQALALALLWLKFAWADHRERQGD